MQITPDFVVDVTFYYAVMQKMYLSYTVNSFIVGKVEVGSSVEMHLTFEY